MPSTAVQLVSSLVMSFCHPPHLKEPMLKWFMSVECNQSSGVHNLSARMLLCHNVFVVHSCMAYANKDNHAQIWDRRVS